MVSLEMFGTVRECSDLSMGGVKKPWRRRRCAAYICYEPAVDMAAMRVMVSSIANIIGGYTVDDADDRLIR
jgi:hypothetical protein